MDFNDASHWSDPAGADANDDNLFDHVLHAIEHEVQTSVSDLDHLLSSQAALDTTLHPAIANTLHPIDWSTLSWNAAPAFDLHAPTAQDATNALVVGDPHADLAYWHQQTQPESCAIASQQFVIEQLTGQRLSEDDLIAQAEAHGWYDPAAGTYAFNCANLLQAYGLQTDEHSGSSIDEIADALAKGHGVIVGLREEKLLNTDPQAPLGTSPTIPGQDADHMVEVIGIDRSDPANPVVILNDPWPPIGAGERVPLATFEAAWATSDNTIVSAWR